MAVSIPSIPNAVGALNSGGPAAVEWYNYWRQLGAGLRAAQTDIAALGTLGAASYPERFYSTNLLKYPLFNDLPWNVSKANADMAIFSYNNTEPAGSSFSHRVAQLGVSGSPVVITHPTDVRIDPTKEYHLGLWGFGNGNVDVLVTCRNAISGEIGTLTITLTLPASPVGIITGGGNTTGHVGSKINPIGGGGIEWLAGTIGASFAIKNSAGNKYIWYAYLIASDQMPTATLPIVQDNGGTGTHEAAWDATTGHLYVISHSFNEVVKYDSNLVRVGACATSDYAHDIKILGDHLYVPCFNGQAVDKIDKSAMTKVSFACPGPRSAIGITTDGTNLIVGTGTPGEGPLLQKLTPSGTWSTISSDLGGGLSNIPVVILPSALGEAWTVKTANSEVKRISIATGATLSTTSCNIGAIYGLGTDGTLIYANGDHGVAVIDATGTLIKVYPLRWVFGGSSNCRPDSRGRMWGFGNEGLWVLDHANGRMIELPESFLGGAKWVCLIPGFGMAVGFYVLPEIVVLLAD